MWPCMLKLPEITSLLFLCNILQNTGMMKLIFLHADEHEGFLQINTMVLIEMVKHFQTSQNKKFLISWQYLKQEVRNEVDFLHPEKYQSWFQHFGHQSFLQGGTIIDEHDKSILKVIKVTSLQYLYNISKLMLGMEFSFCMQINISVSAS